jgi:hypothetical protein
MKKNKAIAASILSLSLLSSAFIPAHAISVASQVTVTGDILFKKVSVYDQKTKKMKETYVYQLKAGSVIYELQGDMVKQLKPQDNYARATVKGTITVKKVGKSYVNILNVKSMQWGRMYNVQPFNSTGIIVAVKSGASYKYQFKVGSKVYELEKNAVTASLKPSDNGKKAKVVGFTYNAKDLNGKEGSYLSVKSMVY